MARDTHENSEGIQVDPASTFVEKLFDVRFQVPPLMLSDWRRRLYSLLSEAFPDHRTEDFDKVIRLVARAKPSPHVS